MLTCVRMCVYLFVLMSFATSCHFPELLCEHLRSKSITIAATKQKGGSEAYEYQRRIHKIRFCWFGALLLHSSGVCSRRPYSICSSTFFLFVCFLCFSSEKVWKHLESRWRSPRFVFRLLFYCRTRNTMNKFFRIFFNSWTCMVLFFCWIVLFFITSLLT